MNVACVGAWRSLVAHLNGVQGVGGSNPLAPTSLINLSLAPSRIIIPACRKISPRLIPVFIAQTALGLKYSAQVTKRLCVA